MDDTISRKDAIETAISYVETWIGCQSDYHRKEIAKRFNQLPFKQIVITGQKRGKWDKLYKGNYKCSVCGAWWENDCNEMVEDFKFCPNCGADMRTDEKLRNCLEK